MLKILLVGDSGSGKSSLLLRYTDDCFAAHYCTTIGVDFKCKSVKIDDKVVKYQIWDTTGQERFRTITSSYYRGVHVILIVFDLTNMSSFDNVTRWAQETERYTSENMRKIIIGNKTDETKKRVVSFDQARELADSLRVSYFETSAKTERMLRALLFKPEKKL